MNFDRETVNWIIEQLAEGYDEYGYRPEADTIRIGDCEHRVFSARNLAEWLIRSQHIPVIDFLPHTPGKKWDTLPTHIRVACSCGGFEGISEVTGETLTDVQHDLCAKVEAHVVEILNTTLDCYTF